MAKKLIARALQTGLRALTPQGGQALAPQIMTTPPLTTAELKKRLREAPPLVASSMGAAAAWGAQREAFALEILSAPDEQRVLAAAQLALSSVLQSVIATQEDRTLIQHIRVLFACVKSALGFLTVQAEPGVRVEAQAQAAANGMPGALLAISLVSTLVLLVVSCLKLSVLGTALSALSLLSMLLFATASLRERRQALSRLPTRITPEARLDPLRVVTAMDRLMEAVDKRLEELAVLCTQQDDPRSEAPDAVLLDLLSELLELESLSGGQDTGAAARRYLTQHGVRVVPYCEEVRAAFDVQPARAGARTIRPALYEGDRLLRRGVAAVCKAAAPGGERKEAPYANDRL